MRLDGERGVQPCGFRPPGVGIPIQFEKPDVALLTSAQQPRGSTERMDLALEGLERESGFMASHLDERHVKGLRHAGRVAEAKGGAW